MKVPEVKPRIMKRLHSLNPGECFLYGSDVMLKLATHYHNNSVHAVRLLDGAQVFFADENPEFESLGNLTVSF